MRVLTVFGPLVPAQMEVWRQAQDLNVDLHVLGSVVWYWPDHDGSHTREPDMPNVWKGRPIGLVDRGPLWWAYPSLGPLVRRLQPDIVHVNSEPYGGLVQEAVALCPNRAVVAHGADNIFDHGNLVERAIRKQVLKVVLPRLAGYASWNAEGAALIRERGLRPEVPVVTAPATVPAPFSFCPRKSVAGDRVRIGFLGRLVPEKGLSWLFSALATDRELVDAVEVNIAGAGSDRISLEAQAQALGLKVSFAGEIAPEQVEQFLHAVDLLVVPTLSLPGYKEQFGRVAVEAMSAGTCLVVSTSGELPRVVGRAGLVVPEGDVLALSRALQRLVSDPEQRLALAVAARERAEQHFHPRSVAKTLVDFWAAVAV